MIKVSAELLEGYVIPELFPVVQVDATEIDRCLFFEPGVDVVLVLLSTPVRLIDPSSETLPVTVLSPRMAELLNDCIEYFPK